MTSTPEDIDPRLVEAHELAKAALFEVTPAETVGELQGHVVEGEGVISLRFANTMPGYPGWFWTVSVAAVEGADPTVLEVELLPSDHALLAPEWVPWAVRLAEYHAAQAAQADEDDSEHDADESDDSDEDADSDFEDVDDIDESEFDTDGSPILHSGDVDGVDIDELDADSHDEDGDSDDSVDADSDESDSDDSDQGDADADPHDANPDKDDADPDDVNRSEDA